MNLDFQINASADAVPLFAALMRSLRLTTPVEPEELIWAALAAIPCALAMEPAADHDELMGQAREGAALILETTPEEWASKMPEALRTAQSFVDKVA